MLAKVKWLGTAMGAMGALLIASNVPESGWAFVLFFLSSTAWTCVGVAMREPPLWSLNSVYMAIDLIGIYRWIINP